MASNEQSAEWSYWSENRQQVKQDGPSFGFGNAGTNGVFTLEAYQQRSGSMAIGVLWYSFIGPRSLQIVNVFVHEGFRRLGIAKLLRDKLFEFYSDLELIVTGRGTPDGLPWLKASGFKEDSRFGWIYLRPKIRGTNVTKSPAPRRRRKAQRKKALASRRRARHTDQAQKRKAARSRRLR